MARVVPQIQEDLTGSDRRKSLFSYRLEEITSSTKHILHQSARFWFIADGECTVEINKEIYTLKHNSFVAILPWETTFIINVEKKVTLHNLIYSEYLMNDIRTMYNSSNEYMVVLKAIDAMPVLQLDPQDAERIMDIFNRAIFQIKEYEKDDNGSYGLSGALVSNRIIELLLEFAYLASKDKYRTNTNLVELDPEKLINSIYSYIYYHISETITLKKLSEIFMLSESSISKYISSTINMSYADFLKIIRVSKAENLLIYSNHSINEIADEVGFADSSHFIKVFMEKNSLTPAKYRELYKKANIHSRNINTEKGFKMIAYVRDNYTEELKSVSVAEKFDLSVLELNQTFLFLTEKNFEDYLRTLRINKACELLLSSDEDIISISLAVGYNNAKSFARNFEKIKGVTPGNFRKKHFFQPDNLDEH